VGITKRSNANVADRTDSCQHRCRHCLPSSPSIHLCTLFAETSFVVPSTTFRI